MDSSPFPIPNHQAVIDDSHIEWLAETDSDKMLAIMDELALSEQLGQLDVKNYLHKIIRGEAASRGRVGKVFDIARNQEAIQVASEVFAPRHGV